MVVAPLECGGRSCFLFLLLCGCGCSLPRVLQIPLSAPNILKPTLSDMEKSICL